MGLTRLVAGRVVFAVVALYLVVTVTFGFVALTADPNVNVIRQQAAIENRYDPPGERAEVIEAEVEAYREARNLDDPVAERYVRWLGAVATFDWGRSHSYGAPVAAVVARHLPYTLAYVVPSLLLATLVGVGGGLYAALRGGAPDRVVTAVAYLRQGVPDFWLASLLLVLAAGPGFDAGIDPGAGPLAPANRAGFLLPTAVLGTGLIAGLLRYARAESLEHAGRAFVDAVRSRGVGEWGVGRHVARNVVAPLLSLFVFELLSVLVVSVYVIEFVFELPGFGLMSLRAIRSRDLPLVLGAAMVVAIVGVVATALQDLVSAALDPRVRYGER